MNFTVYCLIASLCFSEAFAAGNIENGQKKSASCIVCHGQDGIGLSPLWPNLAGQKEEYLILQLKQFRSNDRKNEIMNPLSYILSDQDIADIAAYYSNLQPTSNSEKEEKDK